MAVATRLVSDHSGGRQRNNPTTTAGQAQRPSANSASAWRSLSIRSVQQGISTARAATTNGQPSPARRSFPPLMTAPRLRHEEYCRARSLAGVAQRADLLPFGGVGVPSQTFTI